MTLSSITYDEYIKVTKTVSTRNRLQNHAGTSQGKAITKYASHFRKKFDIFELDVRKHDETSNMK